MGGTRAGALKALQTIKEKHGDDFYAKVGALGGKAKTTKPKGFAARPDIASTAGRKGGSIGKRERQGSKLSPETLELLRLQQIHWEANR